jgi:hypothetical protein
MKTVLQNTFKNEQNGYKEDKIKTDKKQSLT